MAYKRTTQKTGTNTRRSVTHSRKGPSTISHSHKSGSVTYTTTTKGSKSYMTRTQRFADGYVERKRVMSSSQKRKAKPKSRRRNKSSSDSFGMGWLVLFGIVCLLSFIFNG